MDIERARHALSIAFVRRAVWPHDLSTFHIIRSTLIVHLNGVEFNYYFKNVCANEAKAKERGQTTNSE